MICRITSFLSAKLLLNATSLLEETIKKNTKHIAISGFLKQSKTHNSTAIQAFTNIGPIGILPYENKNLVNFVQSIEKVECKKIFEKTKLVLLNAIKKGGSSIRDFKNISGSKGSFQKNFKVYQREGLKCKRVDCKGIIQKKNISNRSTFFCAFCQK